MPRPIIRSTLVLLFLCVVAYPAQQPKVGRLKDFKVPLFFDPQPGQTNRLKSLLLGTEAELGPNGQFPLKGLRLVLFHEDGQTNLLAETAACVYTQPLRTATGDQTIQVHSGDGKITIGGVGFLWRETNTSLVIPSQVRTLIQQEQPIHIRAEHFEYLGDTNQVYYYGQVVATNSQMQMSSGALVFRLPAPGKSLERAVAETNVVYEHPQEHLTATGDRAEYTDKPDLKLVELTGNPAWQRGPRQGQAEYLQYDRLHRAFLARGHSYTKLPRADLEQPAFWLPSQSVTNTARAGNASSVPTQGPLPAPAFSTNAASLTNQFIEIFADETYLQTNQVACHGKVRVIDPAPTGPPSIMNGGHLRIESSPKSGKLEKMEMEEDVVIRQADSQITSARLVYTKTNELAEFTGHPAWQSGPHQGGAELILLHSDTKVLQARQKTQMKLYLGSGNLPLGMPAQSSVNTSTSTNHYLLITADEYDLHPGRATFRGSVRAHEFIDNTPKDLLSSDLLTVNWSEPSNRIDQILADRNVIFEQGIKGVTNGPSAYQKITGDSLTVLATNGTLVSLVVDQNVVLERTATVARGAKLSYDASAELALLTGHPEVTSSQSKVVLTGPTILYDRKQDRFFIPSNFHFELKVKEKSDKTSQTQKPAAKKGKSK